MRFVSDFLNARGQRVITCPETAEGAAVSIDALHAGLSGDLRLSRCTRWPERADCAQACLSQITESADGCRVSALVTAWYAGKNCTVCKRPIGPIVWHEAPPAVMKPNGMTSEWKDVPVENLASVFLTSQPICWYCNNVMELERMRPDLVVHRAMPVEKKAPLAGGGIY